MNKPIKDINWKNKGFGWIPDLPNIADPDLAKALTKEGRILNQENTAYIEEATTSLVNLLRAQSDQLVAQNNTSDSLTKENRDKEIRSIKAKLQDIETKLIGNTRFPDVQVYKVLRKGSTSAEKAILQLRQALYLIYSQHDPSSPEGQFKKKLGESKVSDLISVNKIFKDAGHELIKWLQTSDFDDPLEKLIILFQESTNLVADGIVGLRTYMVINAILSDHKTPSQEASLLCSSSLIPAEILEEVFDQLCSLWLQGKLVAKIDIIFENFYWNNSLDAFQIQEIRKTKKDLYYMAYKHVDSISKGIRRKAKANGEGSSREELNIDALYILREELIEEIEKCGRKNKLTIQIKPLAEKFKSPLIGKLELSNSFVVNSKELFVEQFELWFHIIEPFISSLLQILSPLSNFDSLKQAVRVGIARLDSCFELHHLEHHSRLKDYRSLLNEYSPDYIIDQVDELQFLKKSVTRLFRETLAKIDRTRREDIGFRGDIIKILEDFLNSQESSQDPESAFLRKVQREFNFNAYDREDDKDKFWRENVEPVSIKIFRSRLDTMDGKLILRENVNLEKEKTDLENYRKFFGFIEDIIRQNYGVSIDKSNADKSKAFLAFWWKWYCKIQGDQSLKAEVLDSWLIGFAYYLVSRRAKINNYDLLERERSVLKSLLTAKEVLFEIDPSKPEKSSEFLLLEPTPLQLPVSMELLRQVPQSSNDKPTENSPKSYFFLPGVVDLSYWCSPVEDQGELNACTAFAGVALMEYFAQKQYQKYTNLSARFLYKTARNLMNRSDDIGVSVRQTIKALVLLGVPPEEVWPWCSEEINEEPPAFCYAYAQNYQTLKYFRLDIPNDVSKGLTSKELLLFQIKAVLAAGLPCIFGFTMYDSVYKEKNIRRGYIPYPSDRDQVVGGHAAVAVGYNDYKRIERSDGETYKSGAILIRNSWGSAWGKGGYGWLPYEYVLGGLTADWWSLLKSEWFNSGAFGLGAVDPGNSGTPKGSD